MRVSEVLASGRDLLGQRLRVKGYFVMVVGEVSYFVDGIEQRDDLGGALGISHPGLADALLGTVPPSGGSKFYYLTAAEIEGTLAIGDEGSFPLLLKEIQSLEIEKSGHRFTITPPS